MFRGLWRFFIGRLGPQTIKPKPTGMPNTHLKNLLTGGGGTGCLRSAVPFMLNRLDASDQATVTT